MCNAWSNVLVHPNYQDYIVDFPSISFSMTSHQETSTCSVTDILFQILFPDIFHNICNSEQHQQHVYPCNIVSLYFKLIQ